jgi:hypothetical protein
VRASKFVDLLQLSRATNNSSTMYLSPAGVILINTFEETFGDMHGEGVWRKFGEKASNINDNVVALASFNGDITMMCHLLFHLDFDYN